jgi:3-dehydroquinate synthase II
VKILAEVKDAEEARVAVETLEVGAAGVVLDAKKAGPKEVKRVCDLMKAMPEPIRKAKKTAADAGGAKKLVLVAAKVTEVRPVGSGDRACIDTTSLMTIGEGMLVGSQAGGLFLVHSESLASEFVERRPFRVNAGAVHAYVSVPGGRTRYISELKAGDDVLIVNADGTTKVAVVGRVKIERRPMLLVEAEYGGEIYKTLLQNAETINLVGKGGKPISVTKLKRGDKILLHVQKGGRHFGAKVEEMLVER